jgi:hypothetical protein
VVVLDRSEELLAMQVRSNRRALADVTAVGRHGAAKDAGGGLPMRLQTGRRGGQVHLATRSTLLRLAKRGGGTERVAEQGESVPRANREVFLEEGATVEKFAGGFHEELERVVAAVSKAEREAPKGGRAAWQGGRRELTSADLSSESPEEERLKVAITRVVGNLVATTTA